MQEFIYYPNFEIQNENWLKFALLYLDKLNPIIPLSGSAYLSERFKQLSGETDLISIHHPRYEEGEAATSDAIEHVEKILSHPERYKSVFKTDNVVQNWRDPKKQKAILFKEKFTDAWEYFCTTHKLGERANEGLQLSNELALIYMTILAHAIANQKGVEPITDDPKLDRFGIFTCHSERRDADSIQTAQAVINLSLPANLNSIPVESVIKQRNRPEFRERQKAFHTELSRFFAETGKGANPEQFLHSLGSLWTYFRDDILKIGSGAMAFGLGVWILLDSANFEFARVLREAASGLSLAIGSTISVKNTWRNTKTKRWTRKYLADLKELKPAAF